MWVLLAVSLAAWTVTVGRRWIAADGDAAAKVVSVSGRRLARTRPEWARAMAAELPSVGGRWARLLFALGCARTALVPPPLGRASRASRVVVAAVVVALVGLGAAARVRVVASPAIDRPGTAYEAAVTVLCAAGIVGHALLVQRRVREQSSVARSARRTGVTVGVLLGVGALMVSLPVPGPLFGALRTGTAGDVALPMLAIGCLLAGAGAARHSGDRASGRPAGVWAGRVAGSILAIGLLGATLWATRWFTHDPATVGLYHASLAGPASAGYGAHFQTVTGFVVSDNCEQALICSLVEFPLLGLAFGTLGGMIGAASRSRRALLNEPPSAARASARP